MITTEEIIAINEQVVGTKGTLLKKNELESVLASYYYYDTAECQICSIVVGIVMNHCFIDGNKRTGLVILDYLSEENNLILKPNDHQMYDIFIKLIKNNLTPSQLAKLVY